MVVNGGEVMDGVVVCVDEFFVVVVVVNKFSLLITSGSVVVEVLFPFCVSGAVVVVVVVAILLPDRRGLAFSEFCDEINTGIPRPMTNAMEAATAIKELTW